MIDLSPYKLVIFDKDGTLIDFDVMWGGWGESLAGRLEAATGQALAAALYAALDYDGETRRTIAGGRLAVTPMTGIFELIAQFLVEHGLTLAEAEAVLQQSWFIPDPVHTARPLADLYRVFSALRERGLKIAVVTSDDRAPTMATLANLGVDQFVSVVIAADDGVALKPAPDMVLAVCRATGVAPNETIVVGDAVPEMEMARAAGAGLAIGVTSGVSNAKLLETCADIVLTTIKDLVD